MKDQNFGNSSCSFNGDLIGHLYGETAGAEKCLVDAHLAECECCSNEFAELSSARRSVGNWVSQEFTGLRTPEFKFEPDRQDKEPTRWSVWTLLGGSRWRVPALGGVAALVVFGAVLFLRPTAVDNKMASVPIPAVSTVPNEIATAEPAESLPVTVHGPNKSNSAETGTGSNVSGRVKSPRKAAERERKPWVTRPSERYTRTLPSDRSVAEGIQTKPSLNGYEEKEDETLRLEDMFSEIDAS